METPHAQIGALVRTRREQADLTQQQLADNAGVSRESVNRLEGGSAISRPRPRKIAQVLQVLGITPAEVTETIGDEDMRAEVIGHLTALTASELMAYVRPRPDAEWKPNNRSEIDLLLVTPDGVNVFIEIKAPPTTASNVQKQLADTLTREGWIVSVPVGSWKLSNHKLTGPESE